MDPVVILVLIRSKCRNDFVSLRWLGIARICPSILFMSDHLLYVGQSYHLLVVQDILKVCCARQTSLTFILHIKIRFLIIIILPFASGCKKHLPVRVHCLTSGRHIGLIIIVTHWLGGEVVIIRGIWLFSFRVPGMQECISIVAVRSYYFWILFLMLWHDHYLILVSMCHRFVKVADQFVFLSLQIRLPLGVHHLRLLHLQHALIFDFWHSFSPLMKSTTDWVDWRWFLRTILSQTN